jgi:hypothetical protein
VFVLVFFVCVCVYVRVCVSVCVCFWKHCARAALRKIFGQQKDRAGEWIELYSD